MNTNGIRHLLATVEGRAIGVFSIRDILRVFARQLLDDEGAGNPNIVQTK